MSIANYSKFPLFLVAFLYCWSGTTKLNGSFCVNFFLAVGCARAGYPGVYANVEDFYEWIKTNACNDPDLDPSISWCEDNSFISGNALMMRQTECSQNYRCDACEGHCRSDQECSGSLECFKRSYEAPFQLIPGCVGTGVASKFSLR